MSLHHVQVLPGRPDLLQKYIVYVYLVSVGTHCDTQPEDHEGYRLTARWADDTHAAVVFADVASARLALLEDAEGSLQLRAFAQVQTFFVISKCQGLRI